MIIEPKIRGFICTTAHPIGCDENVRTQIKYVKESGTVINSPKKVLIIGSSTGYGLSSRIVSAFGFGAATIGVALEKPASNGRTATAGWYNTAAFDKYATSSGLYSKNIIGDAFSAEIKQKTIDLIKTDLGKIDMLIYSLAAPRRTVDVNNVYSSVLKPIKTSYTNKSIDLKNKAVINVTIDPATDTEVNDTIKVMGGEDWQDWVCSLRSADAIDDNFTTIAYSYIGPAITHPIYCDGTIGMAKKHLEKTANEMTNDNCKAYVSVNKALVTQSSSAIPIVPLYISILYKLMSEQGTHEGCIEQIYRLFKHKMYSKDGIILDESGKLRIDDWEMEDKLQTQISEIWNKINTNNINEYSDINAYNKDFLKLFGFEVDNVDYSEDVNIDISIQNLI